DGSGNTSTCTSTVTVADSTSPTASCQDITVFLDGTGNASIVAADIDNGSTDNCSTVTLAASTTAFTCADLGANTVTLTVTDGSGNTSTCTSTVTVSDSTSPTASCQDITVFLDGAGNATIVAADIDNGSTDNCSTVTLAASTSAFTCADLGANTVTLTVTDGSGNSSTCTSTVTVSDSTAPTASCQDITVFLDGAGNATIVAADIDNGSADNCSTVTLAASTTTFTCADVGANTVTLTVTDIFGNTSTCTSTVTVADTITPTITCPGDVIVNNDPGLCSASGIVLGTPTIGDNCAGTTFSNDGLTTYPVGVTNVTWTVTDASGNTSQCIQTVTVNDNEAPVLPTILDVNVECGVTIPVPAATDNCAGVVLGLTTDPLTYTTQGTFVINWTFDDGSGNVVGATQNVVVSDVTAPLVVTPLPDVIDECSATVTAPTANDACAGVVTGTTTTVFPITTQGITVVTWTYDDGNGNTSSQNQNVIIDDVTLPVPDVATLTDITAECEVTTLTPPTATDNCSGALVGTNSVTLPITSQGTTVVTWTFDDGNGNISTQDQNVIINDVTAPVPDVPTLADVTGECSAVVTAPTATDACGGVVVNGTTTDPVTYTSQGTYTVTWSFTDANGNTSTQTQTVIVNDVTPPVADATTLPDVVELCSATLQAPTATDNCSGLITGTTTTTFPITASTLVTWTYDDGNGNVSTQDQLVTITGVDVSTTTVSAVEITANNPNGDSYQWIDCDNGNVPVANGTNQNYIATANGSYAVIINENGCIDTSACVVMNSVGIDEVVQLDFNIYPNPIVDGKFMISFDGEIAHIELQDLQGRMIKVLHSASTGEVNVSDLARGKYFVRITTATDQLIVKSIIIQ
ncbi:MAG: HYR domain-containing protein, partial [Crocinitomicaceae bacterium]|nr:HYR domain-containing protein [Crocinitomicaceae bacterium]